MVRWLSRSPVWSLKLLGSSRCMCARSSRSDKSQTTTDLQIPQMNSCLTGSYAEGHAYCRCERLSSPPLLQPYSCSYSYYSAVVLRTYLENDSAAAAAARQCHVFHCLLFPLLLLLLLFPPCASASGTIPSLLWVESRAQSGSAHTHDTVRRRIVPPCTLFHLRPHY